MFRNGVSEGKDGGKAGFRGWADHARTPKMFVLAIQEIEGAVTRAGYSAQLLNDALPQGDRIGHRADFGGETRDDVQEGCG